MNKGNLYVFRAACRLALIPDLCKEEGKSLSLTLHDIDELDELPQGATTMYSFWVGMPLTTQQKILSLSAACPSVTAIAVFRDSKWTSTSAVLDALDAAPCIVRLEPLP